MGLKQPFRDVNGQSAAGAEVKNEWSCTSTPPPICLHSVDRENFNIYLFT
jgi:hypothetical protein